jgi:hypothetical protein
MMGCEPPSGGLTGLGVRAGVPGAATRPLGGPLRSHPRARVSVSSDRRANMRGWSAEAGWSSLRAAKIAILYKHR